MRATKPDELWHVDTTVIPLVNDTKVYLHAVIDNFSRRMLAWRVTDHFEVAKRRIRATRVQTSRAASCAMCWQPTQTNQGNLVTA